MGWADLSPDLLRLISKKLGDISNVICFRVVCKNWRLSIHPSDYPPQLPWFLKYGPDAKGRFDLELFSPYFNKTRTLRVSESKGELILGPSKRYVIMHDEYGLRFLNPLTGSHFNVTSKVCGMHPVLIFLGANPTGKGDIAIFLAEGETWKSWRSVVSVVSLLSDAAVLTKTFEVPILIGDAVAYYKERLYCSVRNTTMVFDAINGDEILVFPQPEFGFQYFIDACGDLLRVRLNLLSMEERRYEIYRLEDGGTDLHWVKLTNGIGDRVLFLSYFGGLCLKAGDFDGFIGNSIYYIGRNHEEYFLARYDLKSNKTQSLMPYAYRYWGSWFIPCPD
ncbi:hypothetical protein LUZ60_007215 [Juncus effusus]|nr:hypothetical protein LUZ60_007215 [Juncus effusus]